MPTAKRVLPVLIGNIRLLARAMFYMLEKAHMPQLSYVKLVEAPIQKVHRVVSIM